MLLCLVLMVVDLALAADPRRVEITRTHPERALRDEPVAGELRVRNLGTRLLRARVRDAWQPTAGAPAERLRFTVPPGERRAAALPLLPAVAASCAALRRRARGPGPLGWPGVRRPSTLRPDPRAAAVHSRRTFRHGWRACASSTATRACRYGVRAPSSTACASTCAETTCARSTGAPPPAQAPRCCAPGARARPARGHRHRHGPHRCRARG